MQSKRTNMPTMFMMLLAIIMCAGVTFYFSQKVTLLNKEVSALEQNVSEKKQLLDNYSISPEMIKTYVSKERSGSMNGYEEWAQAVTLAESLYKKSDGQFKKEWGLFLFQEAKRYDIDPYVVFELLSVETGGTFNPSLTGPQTQYGRAYGMSQFMKNTAPWIAEMANLTYKDELLFDPLYSIQLSIVYLDFLHERYGNWDQALTAYHRGIFGMHSYVRENGSAKSWYATKIQTEAAAH
ncbi:transglycosylase SLT domain-containing protein [Aureibacillus halotolerans]|uniref:Transglycosylase-like protein with SLT domain n=1 Tax=Aureibacillus halotolerans TaxID=1508390 RepID=A0A4R6UAJ7_9BACI|nr:transglycosylase SLT domain-containing protein [Aureibacillus halotolerans]TDQ41715.1 transglycosylase-like protein with SLT domain [Aureibacillus halotolerans]